MSDNRKKSSFGGIFGFILIISIFSRIFEGGGFVVFPFIMIVVGMIAVGYFIRKANLGNTRNNSSENDKPDIFEIKEKQYQEKQYKLQKSSRGKFNKDSQSVKHDYSHRCPKCHTLISSKDKICPECGALQLSKIRCPKCGHDNPVGNVLCENCNDFLY